MAETNFTLWFNEELIGTVRDGFLSDGVWYGIFELNRAGYNSKHKIRVEEFILFCESWNELIVEKDSELDPSHFDSFSDVVYDGDWIAKSSVNCSTLKIENAPVFFKGSEISFRIE